MYPFQYIFYRLFCHLSLTMEKENRYYTIVFKDASYTQWTFLDPDRVEVAMPELDPFVTSHRILTGDAVRVLPDETKLVECSPARVSTSLCGVLVLNKTFGRNAKGRLLYQCIPYAKDLPPFFVPYDLGVEFSKVVVNRYILFRFDAWTSGRLPLGTCTQVFGAVDSHDAYFQYLMHAYGLYPRVKSRALNPPIGGVGIVTGGCPDVEDPVVFTMDPAGAEVFDDALSFWHETGGAILQVVDIFIADAFSAFCPASDLFGGWASNIYLPDKRLSMFNTGLVRTASLDVGVIRKAVRLRLRYDSAGVLHDHAFACVDPVVVHYRGVYGAPIAAAASSSVAELKVLTARLCTVPVADLAARFSWAPEEAESRALVWFWMGEFNRFAALHFSCNNLSAFCRGLSKNTSFALDLGGPYEYTPVLPDMGPLLQLTSPLRRRVDFMNQAILVNSLQKDCSCLATSVLSPAVLLAPSVLATSCLAAWVADLPRVNRIYKYTFKLTSQMHLLHYVAHHGLQIITGRVVDIGCASRCASSGRCASGRCALSRGVAYFPVLKTYCAFRVPPGVMGEVAVDTDVRFRLYYFARENEVKKKIRVEPLLS